MKLTITFGSKIILRADAHVSSDKISTLSSILTRHYVAEIVYCNTNNMEITLHYCFTVLSLNSNK